MNTTNRIVKNILGKDVCSKNFGKYDTCPYCGGNDWFLGGNKCETCGRVKKYGPGRN